MYSYGASTVEQNYHVESQQVNSLGQHFPYFPLYSYPKLTRTATAGFQIEDVVLKKSSANKQHNPSPVPVLADLFQRLRLINKEAEKQQQQQQQVTTTRGRICLSI